MKIFISNPWLQEWAAETAQKTSFSHVEKDECEQEIILFALEIEEKLSSIYKTQGETPAKAWLGRSVHRHLMNLNRDLGSQLSGLNGVDREGDSAESKLLKRNASVGAVSLNKELEDGGFIGDIIPDEAASPEEALELEEILELAGPIRAILCGEVTTHREWAEAFPEASQILGETLALREMAIRSYVSEIAEGTQQNRSKIEGILMDFFAGWRGERGNYGDGDITVEEDIKDALKPRPEVAWFFPEGTGIHAVLMGENPDKVPGLALGFADGFIEQVKREIVESVPLLNAKQDPQVRGFVAELVNYAWSYLRFNDMVVKFEAVQERLQQDLFGFEPELETE